MKTKRLKNEYSNNVLVIVGCSEKHFRKMVLKLQPDYDCFVVGDAAARTENPVKDGVHHYLLWFPKNSDAETVVHECIHLKNWLFKDHDVKHDFDNDEHEAYLTSYLFEQVMKVVRRK